MVIYMQKYLMQKRILLFFYLVIIAFIAIFIRLGYITFVLSNKINPLAYELWTREIAVNSSRGKIYDRNGKLIVGNKLAISLASINKQVKDKAKTAQTLSDILNVEYEKIYNHLNKNVSVELIKPEGRKINEETAKKIVEANLEGIYLISDSDRYYPNGSMLAATTGFCGIDGDGLAGLEYIYNDYLKPIKGSLNIYTDAKGNIMPDMVSFYESSTPGMDIYLTIDLEIQTILDRVITNAVSRYSPDQALGLIVNAKTGEVLAMSSYPTFEAGNYQAYPQEIYNRNLPIWMSYEPGSTFKVVTYSAGLEEKVFNLNDHFYDPGYKIVGGARIKDWKAGGHGDETFLQVIENSCNPGFMEIGERLGISKFHQYLKNYGFGEKTGIDLLGESKGIIFKEQSMGPVELATASFGQGNSVTPIQLVMAAAASVNGGNLLTPYILDNVEISGTKEIVYENTPKIKRKVISEQTSSIMRYALESVVAKGTGRGAFVEGYRVGGKTGTAQKVGENGAYMQNNYIISFLGMAPMNDPEIVCYLAIDNPKNTIQYGGVVAAPLVGEILKEVLPTLGVEKDTKNQIEKEYRYYIDNFYYSVPELVGSKKKDISSSPYYKYLFLGNGDTVIDQEPKAGEKIAEGGTIMVYLG